ncbi:MAG TPA: tellurite resistance/C4-dicarboxylate transporter family protein [Segeticoccus sp.]|uniref:tellurite resistance/C4-dicarboxylate transporter family protein n=1 Tax=Segeticoccus sp. TaxID=2706531 RepID=UPI002D7FC0DD|nr:tellurite resistance/C4-dicarboxylate transporter family protein [Segeticoccus sp.]HET8599778.1 tellurite resistance/C4-dicarboxylate transporter family protein [Segeticoccus sp.]
MSESLAGRVQQAVRGLTPGYFALVMASGILSIGMHLAGRVTMSLALLVVCGIAYVSLVVLTLWRLMAYRDAIVDDFIDPGRAFGFFTFIAGTNVFGVRLALDGLHTVTAGLLAVAALTWVVLGYVIPWTAVLSRTQRPVITAANGTWFIWVVASQSVAASAATLEPMATGYTRDVLAVVAVFSWSVGVFLYASAGVFVAARMLLYELRPIDLSPPYWVAMGAAAITVLAGARIVEMADAPMVAATRGLISGASVVFWAFATWLIPVLVAAGWWRHWRHHIPLGYEATLWSIIFPLGMYAAAGLYLGRADHLPIVSGIGHGELWVAFAAWVLTFVAMVRNLVRTVALPPPASRPVPDRD